MKALSGLALVELVRNPGRTLIRVLTLAAAVALLAAMLLFIGHSLKTMTESAMRSVAVDWQGPVTSYSAAAHLASGIASQPGILQASPVATSPFSSAAHVSRSTTWRSATGAILAVPPGYASHIRTFRFLRGSLQPGGVVLDQQLAATLHAQLGDTVRLTPGAGAKPVPVRVTGVALVTVPDVLFQPLNPALGPGPAQPPANVAILPIDTFARSVAPQLETISPANPGSSAVPGAQTGVQWQVQVQVDPNALAGSPAHALIRAGQLRNSVERTFPGRIQFVDNLSDSLTTAATDSLYAQTLYIMLAAPGALVALGLAYLAALGAVQRNRRELALLRARGASRRQLLGVAALESGVLGLAAGALGTGAALLAVHLVASAGGIDAGRALVALGICIGLAFAGALATRVGSTLAYVRSSVVDERRSAQREGKPLWARLYLDLVALAVAGLVYWLTARTGFSAVINPDSNPTLSLSVYMFLAPALLWIGAALLLIRVRGRALAWLAARVAGKRPSSRSGFLLTSASRRGSAINRGLLLVGLLLAFGVNLALFTATYNQQARVDAQLTLGADVVVTAPPGAAAKNGLAGRVASVAGVAAVSAVDHSYAYVGPDLQDTFGIDAATLGHATSLRDSYFLGGSATQILARLAQRRDAILVSRETITDYSLSLGDLVKLRVLDQSTGRFRVAPFHVVGVVQEFPAAPKDSFMVANLTYLQSVTHDQGANVLFVKTKDSPVNVAHRIAAVTARDATTVKDIEQQTQQTVSSITSVDLGGISRIEGAFTVLLVVGAMWLFIAIALAERRHEFATMAALGASLRELAAFLWSEAALVLAAAFALAALLGWVLAEMLVAMLRHVFDPPPDHLAAPWPFLGGIAAAALAGALLAGIVALVGLRRLPLGAILREE